MQRKLDSKIIINYFLLVFYSWLIVTGNIRYAAAVKSLKSCPALCNPIDGSPPGSPVPGIFQARTLEWVAISSYNEWHWKVKVKLLSCIRLFVTPWTTAHQAPSSMGFSRQEYWSGVPLPSLNVRHRFLEINTLIETTNSSSYRKYIKH